MSSVLERRKRIIWLTSFGDLLTLLLCFFMTMASFANLNAQKKTQENQPLTGETVTFAKDQSAVNPGPQLASSLEETGSAAKMPAALPFLLKLKAESLQAGGLESELARLTGIQPQLISLQACNDDLKTDEPALRALLERLGSTGSRARLMLGGCQGSSPEVMATLLFE